MFKKKRTYLDYASATSVDKKVRKLMSLKQQELFANPSSIFYDGIVVKNNIDKARKYIAESLNAHSEEIIFTGSGTESNGLAIIGFIHNFKEKNPNILPHIITTSIEHPSVLENIYNLEKNKEVTVTYIDPNKDGFINPKDIGEAIRKDTILVSVMYANNEIGEIEPIEEIAKEIRFFRKKNNSLLPAFHTDACQAMNYLYTENVEKLGVDIMTFNSSKIYGPKGIGVLYKKRNIELSPLYFGGGQEFGLRSGTENSILILGLSLALRITNNIKNRESQRITKIRDYCIDKLLSLNVKPFKIILNGSRDNRLPNNINISVIGIASELLVLELDAKGVEVSEKSACHSRSDGTSYVILKTREDKENVNKYGSIRISLGRGTRIKDVDLFVKQLYKILLKYRGVI